MTGGPRANELDGLVARQSTVGDRALHAALFAESRRDDLLGSGLDTDRAERMVAFQEVTFEEMLHVHPGGVEDLTWVWKGWPLARLVLHRTEDRVRIVWLVVAESGRRRGVGTHIVGSVLADHTRVVTRVSGANVAGRALFESLGFRVVDQTAGDLVLLHGPMG